MDAELQMDSALSTIVTIDRKDETLHCACTILGGLAGPMILSQPAPKAARMTERFLGVETSALWELVSLSFSGEAALKWEKNRLL